MKKMCISSSLFRISNPIDRWCIEIIESLNLLLFSELILALDCSVLSTQFTLTSYHLHLTKDTIVSKIEDMISMWSFLPKGIPGSHDLSV